VIALAGRIGLRLATIWTLSWALLFSPAIAADGPQFPELTGRVVDQAHVLSPETQADLTAKLAALETKTSRQLVVVTLPTLGGYAIEDYGVQLLRHWGVGQKGINNGVVFIVVPTEHKVRIEVGYGMEGVMTDALSSVILHRTAIPKFKAGDIQGGVVDATDASTAEARVAAAEQSAAATPVRRGHGSPLGGILPIILIIFIISSIFRRRRYGYGGGGGLGWLVPFMFLGGGRGGGWGGGGGGGDWGGGGGGGFSGGGGSGGGGGASGSW
jgi:uncharacterized protein